jgi:hypothetical protein
VREFVLLGLRSKAEFVDVVDDLAEVVALWMRFFISPKISPILYSMVFGPLAFCLKPWR